MILIKLNKNSDQALFQQIFEKLKKLIERGTIPEGSPLPSTRMLAQRLGVNRATVYRAYEELWAAGYIESTSGAYSRVRNRQHPISNSVLPTESRIDWNEYFSDASKRISSPKASTQDLSNSPKLIDFRTLSPDLNLMPIADFRKCLNAVLKEEGAKLLDYSDPLGYLPLRKYLGKLMGEHGIQVSSDEIALTNGTQNGLELILRLLTKPDDLIIIEQPTYALILPLLDFLGLQALGVQITKDGMDLDLLEHHLKQGKAKLIYSMPSFHNPTGLSSSQAYREEQLALCEKYAIPLVEDGFEEEMKYFGKAVLPVKSMDKHQLVIYLGTFSKILFPGIRIGWIAAPEALIAKIADIKRTTELSGNPLNQAALLRFCEQGLFELHKKRIHRIYRKRMQVALQACREFLNPEKVHFTKPDGGYLIWLSLLSSSTSEDELNQQLLKNDVALSPGSRCFSVIDTRVHFRLCIARLNETEIWEGIKRIGETINNT